LRGRACRVVLPNGAPNQGQLPGDGLIEGESSKGPLPIEKALSIVQSTLPMHWRPRMSLTAKDPMEAWRAMRANPLKKV
jgi:hypothetical protein